MLEGTGVWNDNESHFGQQNILFFLYLFLLPSLSPSCCFSFSSFLFFYFMPKYLPEFLFSIDCLPQGAQSLGEQNPLTFLTMTVTQEPTSSRGQPGALSDNPEHSRLNLTGSFSDLQEFSRSILPFLDESKCALNLPVSPCPHSSPRGRLEMLTHTLQTKNTAPSSPQKLTGK